MTTYRVEIDGVTVWSDETETDEGAKRIPAEYLRRPADTPADVPHPSPPHLYIDDVLIGIQRSFSDEADELEAAAAVEPDEATAVWLRGAALDARAHAADGLGDSVAAARFRLARAELQG